MDNRKKETNREAEGEMRGSQGQHIHYWAPDRLAEVFSPQNENVANIA